MKLLTVAETAALLSISKSMVYQLKDGGALPFYRIGAGAIRFNEEDLLVYLASCKIEAGTKRPTAARPSSSARPFKHLNGERLLAAWQKQGVRIGRQDARNAPTSE
jgi:excisionase family DNA binding protein